MAERLSLFRQPPGAVLDWWPHAGGSAEALRAALPTAELLAVGPVQGSAGGSWAARWKAWRSTLGRSAAAARTVGRPDELPEGTAAVVWANMLLHHEPEPQRLFAAWHRVLAVGGFLMFSTVGPGSLEALRTLYRDQGWGEPMGPLVDMHDWGDMLVEAGFADPVMDQETVRLTYARPEQALAELRTLGANAHPKRQAGLRTPRWQDRLLRGLVAHTAPADGVAEKGHDRRVELTFELVYGHAFKPPPRLRVTAETRVDVQVLKDALRRPNGPGFR